MRYLTGDATAPQGDGPKLLHVVRVSARLPLTRDHCRRLQTSSTSS